MKLFMTHHTSLSAMNQEIETPRKNPYPYGVFLVALAGLAGLVLVVLVSYYASDELRVSADSRQYHFTAVNMLAGKGYADAPVGETGDYDPWTRASFPEYFTLLVNPATPPQTAEVTPGYPMFLATIYALHGVSPRAVVFYQHVLVFFIGVLMVVLGHQLIGRTGALLAAFAVVLLGSNPEFAYPASALLSEIPATLFLLLAFNASLRARERMRGAEAWVGLIFTLAVLIRPALIFAALLYGALLLVGCRDERFRRAFSYAWPCVLLLGAWIAFASYKSGEFVPLASYGTDAFKMGLRGETGKKLLDQNVGSEVIRNRDVSSEFRRALVNPRASLAVVNSKVKESLERMPRFLWNSVAMGFALLAAISFRQRPTNAQTDRKLISVHALGVGWLRQRRSLLAILAISAMMLFAVGAGWSTPWIQLWFMLLPLLALFIRLEVEVGPHFPVVRGDLIPLLAWFYGFLAIIVLTIGLSRYMRPFLPEFYLLAVLSLPCLIFWFSALLEVSFARHGLRFSWSDDHGPTHTAAMFRGPASIAPISKN